MAQETALRQLCLKLRKNVVGDDEDKEEDEALIEGEMDDEVKKGKGGCRAEEGRREMAATRRSGMLGCQRG